MENRILGDLISYSDEKGALMFHYAAPVQQLDYSIPIQLETLESPRLGSERTRRKRRISLHLLLSLEAQQNMKFLEGTGRGLAFLATVAS